jgi:Terminase large subunit, T4likevirus-type, N-terminal
MNSPEIIWSPQEGPQTHYVTCPVFELFYGGARGGGKTEGSIGDWFSHAQAYGEAAIGLFIRRQLTQLSEAIARCKSLGAKIGAKWYEQKKELVMPNGARLKFAYLERDTDAEQYQGHSYTRIYVEEATNFPFPDPIMKLKATLRSSAGVPCGIRLTGNPGGPGHHWVKARYIDPCPGGYQIIKEEEEFEFELGVKTLAIVERVFIPAKLKDNKRLLEKDPAYPLRLKQSGSEALVKAWLEGLWDEIEGTYFSEFSVEKHVIPASTIIPPHWARFRAMDWGSAQPFSVGWYAVSDGTIPGIARECLIKYAEWYGWNGQPNKGLKMSAATVAQGVKRRDGPIRLQYGVADPSIFTNNGGPSIAEMMLIEGCEWFRGDNARQAGWEQLRKRLAAEMPLILFTEHCEHTIRTLPFLQHDEKKPEDLDTHAEDHAADETRYAVMSRPIIKDIVIPNLRKYNPETAVAMPTINQLIARQKQRDSSVRY